ITGTDEAAARIEVDRAAGSAGSDRRREGHGIARSDGEPEVVTMVEVANLLTSCVSESLLSRFAELSLWKNAATEWPPGASTTLERVAKPASSATSTAGFPSMTKSTTPEGGTWAAVT